MKKLKECSSMLLTLVAAILLFAGGMNGGRAQEPPAKPAADQPKTAEQQFKNIQVLKGIPADQLIPSMQFITASLGVECDFCHVEHAMDKDDKKTKLAARKMITMVLALNQAHFNGELEVTCYTCHRGAPHPVGTPILSAEPVARPEHVHDDEDESHAGLPTPDQVLDKFLAAVGGADAVNKIKTRVQKGKIDAAGTQYPGGSLFRGAGKARLHHPPDSGRQRHRLQWRSGLAEHAKRFPPHDRRGSRSRAH